MGEDDPNTFSIAFDTESMPGKVLVTTVRLERRIFDVRPGFEGHVFRVNLIEHPLYRELQHYIRNNGGL